MHFGAFELFLVHSGEKGKSLNLDHDICVSEIQVAGSDENCWKHSYSKDAEGLP